MAFERLQAQLELDASGFRSGVEDAQSDLGGLQDRVASAGRSMQRVGGLMSAGLTAPLSAIGVASVSTASDVEESTTKMNAVFDEQTEQVEAWAEDTADAMNRSRYELQETATSYADMLVPMGASREEAAHMSTEMAELTEDLASFNNKSSDAVQQDLQSVLAGRSETMNKYGVDVSAAAVEQELLNQGIEGGREEATRMEEAQARLSIIMRESEDAMGDAERTSDSFANQMRGLRADTQEVRAEIGQHLIPIATALVGRLSSMVSWFSELSETQQKTIIVVGGLVAIVGPLIALFGTMLVALPAAASGFAILTGAASAAAGALTAVSVAGLPIWGLLAGLAAGAAALYVAWDKNILGIQEKSEWAFGLIGDMIEWLIRQINRIPGVDIDIEDAKESIGEVVDGAKGMVPDMNQEAGEIDDFGEEAAFDLSEGFEDGFDENLEEDVEVEVSDEAREEFEAALEEDGRLSIDDFSGTDEEFDALIGRDSGSSSKSTDIPEMPNSGQIGQSSTQSGPTTKDKLKDILEELRSFKDALDGVHVRVETGDETLDRVIRDHAELVVDNRETQLHRDFTA